MEMSVKVSKADTWSVHAEKSRRRGKELQRGKKLYIYRYKKWIAYAVKRTKALEEEQQLAQEQPAWVLVSVLNSPAAR